MKRNMKDWGLVNALTSSLQRMTTDMAVLRCRGEGDEKDGICNSQLKKLGIFCQALF
jgi:hypothetical protein